MLLPAPYSFIGNWKLEIGNFKIFNFQFTILFTPYPLLPTPWFIESLEKRLLGDIMHLRKVNNEFTNQIIDNHEMVADPNPYA